MRQSKMRSSGLHPLQARMILGEINTAVTAAGTTVADATALMTEFNIVTAGGASTGVKLQSGEAGDEYVIYNKKGSALKVYAPSGGYINDGTADAAVSLANNKVMWAKAIDATHFTAIYFSATETELAVLSGATTANNTASKAAILDAAGAMRNPTNAGTAATGVTAVEYGDGYTHTTILTVASTLPAIAGGAALGVGKLLYTLPAGNQIIHSSYMSMGITQTQAHINADTPKVGLGSVIAVGAVSVLNGTATFMDLITEQTAANCTGTATVKAALATTTPFVFITAAAGAKTIHFNAAASWAASGDAAAILAGTVVLHWSTMA